MVLDGLGPGGVTGRTDGAADIIVVEVKTNPMDEGCPTLDFGEYLVDDGAVEQGGQVWNLYEDMSGGRVVGVGHDVVESGLTDEGG